MPSERAATFDRSALGARVALGALGAAALFSAAACQEVGFTTCDSLICPQGYQCRADQCVSDEQVAACAGRDEESECTAELDGWCRGGYCQIDLCGNGQLDTYPRRGDEACDGALGRLACADVGSDFGLTACTETCSRDPAPCESFAWRRAITNNGAGRQVVVEGDGIFVARGNLLAAKREDGWRQSPRLSSAIGDVVPLAADQALVAAQRSSSALGLWHYRGASNELVDTGLSVPTAGAQWTGGVALDATRALVSMGSATGGALTLLRQIAGEWSDAAVPLTGLCVLTDSLSVQWAASATVVYAAHGAQVLRLALTLGPGAPSAACSVVRTLGHPVLALGGRNGQLGWAVDQRGQVYDASDWSLRNINPADDVPLDAAVAQYVSGVPRLWAAQGDNVLVFEGRSWWRSRSGSAVLRDDLGGRFANHRPLAVDGSKVLAAQSSQEAGLVQRNDREWLLGWETQGSRGVLDVAVDDNGLVWTLLEDGRAGLGAREGQITPALVAPLSPITLVNNTPYVGAANGLYRLASSGSDFSATREGSALTVVRGAFSDGSTLYALAQAGLFAKPLVGGDWSKLLDAGSGDCVNPMRMTGAMVSGAPRLFLLCRTQGTQPRLYKLLVVDPGASPLAPIAVDLPDYVYNAVAAGGDGTAWLVSSPQAVQVKAPYREATLLPVERLSPATGKLGPLTEAMTDVLVAPDGAIYLAAARQNLFAWDGARFVRISASQGNTAAYVALAARGAHLYAAHQSGVDLLLRYPAP